MQRPRVPGSLTLGRVLLLVESVLWLLGAVAVAGVGVWFLSAGGALSNRLQQLGYSGANVSAAAGVVGGTVLAFAVVILVISFIGIWSGAAMGRLTGGPRVTGLVLASLGLIVGLLSTVGGSQTYVDTSNGTTFQSSPIPGLILIVLNVAIIWTLGLAASARAAFGGVRAGAGYPMAPPPGYGPPPGYPPPGYGPAPGYPTPPSAPPPWPPSPYYAPPPPPDPGQGYPTPPPLGAPTGPAYQPPGSPPLSPPPDPPSSSPPSPAGP